MKPQTVRILSIVVTIQLVVLALVLWARRDTGDALEAFNGSDGYLVVTLVNTEVGPNPYFATAEREVMGITAGSVQTRHDPTYGDFGAYGDSLESTCDRDALARFLTDVNPGRGAYWASAQGIDNTTLADFIGQLRGSVLVDHTLVTSHQFDPAGAGIAEETVLAPGTAVLVDADDNPRVRCLGGSPITPASSSQAEEG